MSKDVKVVPPSPTPSISHWPSQKEVRKLADDLDDVVEVAKAISSAKNRLSMDKSDAAKLKSAKGAVTYYVAFGGQRRVTSGELWEQIEECSTPDGWLDKNGDVQQPGIAKMIAKLVGSFPTSNVPDPAIFARALIEDVMALDPSYLILEAACQKLRTSLKFMPSISEVIAEIAKQEQTWDERCSALCRVEKQHQELVKLIADTEGISAARAAAAERERERREAKAAPVKVGDRVHNWKAGAGVVIEVLQADCRVQFDSRTDECLVPVRYLEKLVEGDEGFSPLSSLLPQ